MDRPSNNLNEFLAKCKTWAAEGVLAKSKRNHGQSKRPDWHASNYGRTAQFGATNHGTYYIGMQRGNAGRVRHQIKYEANDDGHRGHQYVEVGDQNHPTMAEAKHEVLKHHVAKHYGLKPHEVEAVNQAWPEGVSRLHGKHPDAVKADVARATAAFPQQREVTEQGLNVRVVPENIEKAAWHRFGGVTPLEFKPHPEAGRSEPKGALLATTPASNNHHKSYTVRPKISSWLVPRGRPDPVGAKISQPDRYGHRTATEHQGFEYETPHAHPYHSSSGHKTMAEAKQHAQDHHVAEHYGLDEHDIAAVHRAWPNEGLSRFHGKHPDMVRADLERAHGMNKSATEDADQHMAALEHHAAHANYHRDERRAGIERGGSNSDYLLHNELFHRHNDAAHKHARQFYSDFNSAQARISQQEPIASSSPIKDFRPHRGDLLKAKIDEHVTRNFLGEGQVVRLKRELRSHRNHQYYDHSTGYPGMHGRSTEGHTIGVPKAVDPLMRDPRIGRYAGPGTIRARERNVARSLEVQPKPNLHGGHDRRNPKSIGTNAASSGLLQDADAVVRKAFFADLVDQIRKGGNRANKEAKKTWEVKTGRNIVQGERPGRGSSDVNEGAKRASRYQRHALQADRDPMILRGHGMNSRDYHGWANARTVSHERYLNTMQVRRPKLPKGHDRSSPDYAGTNTGGIPGDVKKGDVVPLDPSKRKTPVVAPKGEGTVIDYAKNPHLAAMRHHLAHSRHHNRMMDEGDDSAFHDDLGARHWEKAMDHAKKLGLTPQEAIPHMDAEKPLAMHPTEFVPHPHDHKLNKSLAKVSSDDAVKALKAAGFQLANASGSHHKFKHQDGRYAVVPHPKKQLSSNVVRNVENSAKVLLNPNKLAAQKRQQTLAARQKPPIEPPDGIEKSKRKQSPAFLAESERIKVNRQKPENQASHDFKGAEWTHPNGHPRCLRCGSEESTTGRCSPSRA